MWCKNVIILLIMYLLTKITTQAVDASPGFTERTLQLQLFRLGNSHFQEYTVLLRFNFINT